MKLTWQHTVIVSVLILVMGTLAVLGKGFDIVGLLGVLAALGYVANQQAANTAATQAVKDQTNGNTTKLLEMVQEQNATMMAILSRLPALPPDSGQVG